MNKISVQFFLVLLLSEMIVPPFQVKYIQNGIMQSISFIKKLDLCWVHLQTNWTATQRHKHTYKATNMTSFFLTLTMHIIYSFRWRLSINAKMSFLMKKSCAMWIVCRTEQFTFPRENNFQSKWLNEQWQQHINYELALTNTHTHADTHNVDDERETEKIYASERVCVWLLFGLQKKFFRIFLIAEIFSQISFNTVIRLICYNNLLIKTFLIKF